MKKIIPLFSALFLILTGTLTAQTTNDPEPYAQTIQEAELKDLLTIVASDAMEGRETGERGQKMAAAFISDHFRRLGLTAPVMVNGQKSYYQPITLYTAVPSETYLMVKDNKIMNFDGIVHLGGTKSTEQKNLEVVFGGNGTEEMLSSLDLSGKAVLVWAEGRRQMQEVMERLSAAKPAALLLVPAATDEDFTELASRYQSYLMNGRLSAEKPGDSDALNTFLIPPSMASTILKKDVADVKKALDSGKPGKFKAEKISFKATSEIREVETENVLGYLEGTDKKDELIVLTAHYDHIGRDGEEINNGADDDGSGTTSIMEIAEAFVKAKNDGNGPRRSILFMTVTGEEKGLLGSAYYAANPVFPLENTVVNLNIDMIGRIDPAHEENRDYVYLVGSDRLSSELHQISEEVNKNTVNLSLDYTYNDEAHPDRIYYRSDHWNFAKNNVPIIFYFTGIHADYHRPSDTVEKINFDLLTLRARLVFYTAWELANRDERIKVDVGQAAETGK
jgi:hypothetical protein